MTREALVDPNNSEERLPAAQAESGFSVAVVIPLFNKEQAIESTIRSVLGQTRLPEELIVVDDGSTDQSVAVAQKELSCAPSSIRWRVITQSNAGVSVARNRGVAETSTRFIAFLDGDDEWAATYLAELERLATAFPEAAVLSAHSEVIGSDGSITPEPSSLPRNFFGLIDRPLTSYRKNRGIMNSSSTAVRRDALREAGGFPEGCHCGEDIFLWLKLGMRERFAHSGASLVTIHAEHSGNALRQALVGHQFTYFLGTAEGRAHLGHQDLARFLCAQLLSNIVWRRLRGHPEVAAQLGRLSQALPLGPRVQCAIASRAPLWLLRAAKAGKVAAGRRLAHGADRSSVRDRA